MLSSYPQPAGSYPHVSSKWQLKYDSSNPVGSRIISLTHNGVKIDPQKDYLVVVTLFMFIGGDNCKSWTEGARISKPVEDSIICSLVIRYLQELKRNHYPLVPVNEERVVDVRS